MIKRIIISANELQRRDWEQHAAPADTVVEFAESAAVSIFESAADIYFLLDHDGPQLPAIRTVKPVFVNAVIDTLDCFPANVIRINAWPGFLARSVIEVVASKENAPVVKETMQVLNRDYRLVPDVLGMIAARTVSMIINEAYYALGEHVSSADEIDTAMKLGTNYPYGPFEWAQKIGPGKIYRLLKELGAADSRYSIAPELERVAGF